MAAHRTLPIPRLSPKAPRSVRNTRLNALIQAGRTAQCRRYLDPELGEEELRRSDADALLHQALLSRILAEAGAIETPLRVADRVLRICAQKRQSVPEAMAVQALYHLAATYLETYSLEGMDALSAEIESRDLRVPELLRHLSLVRLQFRIFSGRQRYSPALEKELDAMSGPGASEGFRAGVAYHRLLNRFLGKAHPPAALLEQTRSAAPPAPEALRVPYRLLEAKLLISLGRLQEADALLAIAPDSLYYRMEALFLRWHCLGRTISLSEKVFLHCFPGLNEYSSLLGNRGPSASIALSDAFLDQLPTLRPLAEQEPSGDCWLIAEGGLRCEEYTRVPRPAEILDLCAESYFLKGRRVSLGTLKSRALIAIVSSGSHGVDELQLADRLYSRERISPASARLRAQNLVTQLKSLGFPVRRDAGRFYFELQNAAYPILFPRNHDPDGELRLLGEDPIHTQGICRVLGVSRRSASVYLKRWLAQGMLKRDPRRYGNYLFRSTESAPLTTGDKPDAPA